MSYSIQEKLIRVNPKTRPGKKIVVNGVVIHWTANEAAGADNIAHFNFFNKGSVYASAHYFVDSKGILRIIPENELAYHVGARAYKTTKYGAYPNGSMIGVEMCVNSDGNFAETYKRAVWLVADLLRRHKLGINKLERHYDITGKSCPKMFTEDAYAKKYMNMTAAQAHAKFQQDVAAALIGATPKPVVRPVHKTVVDSIQGQTFSPGTKGTNVGLLQQGLVQAGFSLGRYGIDKSYGNDTRNAVIAFQRAHKLTPDGYAGPMTLAKLQTVLVAKVVEAERVAAAKAKAAAEAKAKAEAERKAKAEAERKAKAEAERKAKEAAALKPATNAHGYTVQKGDTLWALATKNKLTVAKLKELNRLKADLINPGDVLYFYGVHNVVKGDTLWGLSRKYNQTVAKLKSLNGLKSDVINPGDVLRVN